MRRSECDRRDTMTPQQLLGQCDACDGGDVGIAAADSEQEHRINLTAFWPDLASEVNRSWVTYGELEVILGLRNLSIDDILPQEMTFSATNLMSVVVYGILLVVAAAGNLAVFCTLFRNRRKSNRVNLFIMHLSLADMIVTFIVLPLEISWHVTVSWDAGDALCRLFMFFRALGFYLSSFILVAISVDRCLVFSRRFALASKDDRRGPLMLTVAWCLSVIASIPQSIIFHTEAHPTFVWFHQCVTFHFFPSENHELAYNLFNFSAVYAFPLVVIVCSYSLILCRMSADARENIDRGIVLSHNGMIRRKYNTGLSHIRSELERARKRTLKMTIVIVSVFIVCWTPYFVISSWWWFDHTSADKIHPTVQKGLFLFAVSNSCMNPIVYGMFSTVFRRSMKHHWDRMLAFVCCRRRQKYRERRYRDQNCSPRVPPAAAAHNVHKTRASCARPGVRLKTFE